MGDLNYRMGKTDFDDGMRVELEAAARDALKATVKFGLWCRFRSKGEGMEAAQAEEMYWTRTTKPTNRSSLIVILRINLLSRK